MLAAASSGVLPKSMMSPTTAGAPYERMSENSSARTWVMDWDSADTIEREALGDATRMDARAVDGRPPSAQAASIRDSSRPPGKNQFNGVTTFLPDASSRLTTAGSAMTGE